MSDDKPSGGEAGISTRTMEIVVALVLLAIGLLVVVDSYRLGSKWGSDGPQSGYFPFYIGLLLCIACIATLVSVAFKNWQRRDTAESAVAERLSQFVGWRQLKLVLSVLIPALVYVLGVQLIGIYVASAVYIALFMRWLGRYSWLKSVAIGVIVSASIFAMFEIWFKVPLFKGTWDPLSFLGY
ncbi:MAG TPA: tripartite tricarboxylate transporter TctB family protein [Vicinamibacterales bacterium]|nr:tripartite tricarboxylate transporter TctB family protein [Vicinamibacterales bacterium]